MTRSELAGRIVILRCRIEGALKLLSELQLHAVPLPFEEPNHLVPPSVARQASEVAAQLKERARRLEKDADALLEMAEVKPS